MKVRLDTIRFEPFSWQENCEVPAASLDRPDVLAVSPVDWRGQITFTDPGFLLQGRLAYEQTLTCTRCLTPFAEPVRVDVQAMLIEAPEAETGPGGRPGTGTEAAERELGNEDLGVYEVQDGEFDSAPLVVEQLLLNVPMKPLCRPKCAGLCPRCGADLNQGPCGCPAAVDERWSALAGLRDQLTKQEGKKE